MQAQRKDIVWAVTTSGLLQGHTWEWERAREWLDGNGREWKHYTFPFLIHSKQTYSTYYRPTIGRKTDIV